MQLQIIKYVGLSGFFFYFYNELAFEFLSEVGPVTASVYIYMYTHTHKHTHTQHTCIICICSSPMRVPSLLRYTIVCDCAWPWPLVYEALRYMGLFRWWTRRSAWLSSSTQPSFSARRWTEMQSSVSETILINHLDECLSLMCTYIVCFASAVYI